MPSPKRASTRHVALPLLPVRDMVVFPGMVTPLVVGRPRSLRALDDLEDEDTIVLASAFDTGQSEPDIDDIAAVATEATIGKIFRLADGSVSVLAQGLRRVRVTGYVQTEPYFRVIAEVLDEPRARASAVRPLMDAAMGLFEQVVNLSPRLTDDRPMLPPRLESPGVLADFVAAHLDLSLEQRQRVLETISPTQRIKLVSQLAARELEGLKLQREIQQQVEGESAKSQREYLLREQLRAIQRELGETDPMTRDQEQLRSRIAQAGMPATVRAKADEELARLAMMPPTSPEVAMTRGYLDWLIALPWHEATADTLDVKRAAALLDNRHYGLAKVKERILEFIAVRKLAGDRLRSPILCFVGPPGVGKTSLGRSIAEALGRSYVRVSLGGVRDEAEIRGHRRTYIGALPGRIIQTMKSAKTINPLFVLDEIDKLSADFRGDPSAALLEALDPEQNHAFSDHYLDVPYDLSQVLFVATANDLETTPPALRDRLEVIEIAGYIEEEKIQIAERFLIPKQLDRHGLPPSAVTFSRSGVRKIIRDYTREAGVRNLEREIGAICRKIARRYAEGEVTPMHLTPALVTKFLGPTRYFWGDAATEDAVGVATGVAWTEMGGDVMRVEVSLLEGKGGLTLTGRLGDVMRESAQAALSYGRAWASEHAAPISAFDRLDVHIHVPAGAVPKDGPSAGVTMASAFVSALTGRAVRRDVAMTGEITLRGHVLPVGGVKEKILAAHRAGIKTFVLPAKNEKDLEETPVDVRRQVRVVLVNTMPEVLAVALQASDASGKSASPPARPRPRSSRFDGARPGVT